jgi:hypothetical protein
VSFEDRMTSIRLLGEEVLPAVREIGKELGILDPFERAARLASLHDRHSARTAHLTGGPPRLTTGFQRVTKEAAIAVGLSARNSVYQCPFVGNSTSVILSLLRIPILLLI